MRINDINLVCLFLILILNTSCSHKKSPMTAKTYNIHKDFIPNDFVLPQESSQKNPTYQWEKQYPSFPSFTKYSLRCPGTNTEQNVLPHKKCLGALHHGLPLYNGKEYIYPKLIALLNFLQIENNEKIIIIRGHVCPKVFSLLNTQEQNTKYLIGAIVKISSKINWEKKLPSLIKKFYDNKKEEDPLYEIKSPDYPIIFVNKEFKFIIHKPLIINSMEIEVLYDKEKDLLIKFDLEDAQNYLHY